MTISDFIGKRFLSRGRGPDAFDCWGLVRAVYSHLYDITLPDFDIASEAVRQISRTVSQETSTVQWSCIAPAGPLPEPCVAVISSLPGHSDLVNHCAVHIGGRRLMHAIEPMGVSIITPDHPYWWPRIRGYYRWMGQEASNACA